MSESEDSLSCEACGKQISVGSRFCPQCGDPQWFGNTSSTDGPELCKVEKFREPQRSRDAWYTSTGFLFSGLGLLFLLVMLMTYVIPPSSETVLDQKFQGPDGFKDIKFGMTTGDVKRILANKPEIKKCEDKSRIECDQMMEVWESEYFTFPDIKSYHVKLLFYENVGLYRIVIDYYAASTRLGSDIYEVLKVRYGSESDYQNGQFIWSFRDGVINLIQNQLPTLADIPSDEVQIAWRKGLEIRDSRYNERIKNAADSLSGERSSKNQKSGTYLCIDAQAAMTFTNAPSRQVGVTCRWIGPGK